MKNFIKLVAFFIVTIVLMAYLLDFLYTFSYQNPVNPRNKPSWLASLPEEKKYDYALFGSSRCLNTVNPVLIDKETGLNGLNLAYNGSNPFEIKLMVHQFIEKYDPEKIFIQVDDRFDRERNDPTSSIFWMPFINDDYVYNQFFLRDSLAWEYRYIPFYRYLHYESKIGVRDVFFSYLKKNNFSGLKGFHSVSGIMKEEEAGYKELPNNSNIHFEEIEKMAETKGIKVYFFTSPYYKFDLNTSVISNHLDNYKDYSKAIPERKYFHDQSHLNSEGAQIFTKLFIDEYF